MPTSQLHHSASWRQNKGKTYSAEKCKTNHKITIYKRKCKSKKQNYRKNSRVVVESSEMVLKKHSLYELPLLWNKKYACTFTTLLILPLNQITKKLVNANGRVFLICVYGSEGKFDIVLSSDCCSVSLSLSFYYVVETPWPFSFAIWANGNEKIGIFVGQREFKWENTKY